MYYYVTFGQGHVHRVNGRTFDCDCVAVIEADCEEAARNTAFILFDDKWHALTSDRPDISYYPGGLVTVDRTKSAPFCPWCDAPLSECVPACVVENTRCYGGKTYVFSCRNCGKSVQAACARSIRIETPVKSDKPSDFFQG